MSELKLPENFKLHTTAEDIAAEFKSQMEAAFSAGFKAGAEAQRNADAEICLGTYCGEEGPHDWPTPETCAEAIRSSEIVREK